MMYTIAVKPKTPTILNDETSSVKLPGYELWMCYIENVHVVPGRVDVPRFIRATEETLRFYPHATGQLVRTGDQWEISLTDAPIVVEVEDSGATSSGLDHEWVLQLNLDLSRFLRTKGCEPSRYPGNPALFYSQSNLGSSHSLLFVKLTLAHEETAIGVSWHHTLGDATVLLRFMQLLSRRYQGDDGLPVPAPSFTKRSFYPPDATLIEAYSPLMLHLSHWACPVGEAGQRYAALNQQTAQVHFKITTGQLRTLRDRIVERGAEVRPSLQDCLTAYIVSVIDRHIDVPVTRLTNAASYRAVPGVMDDPAVAGNAIYIIPCILDPKSTLEEVACSIRRSIMQSREPSFVEKYMRVASHLMLSVVNQGRTMCFAAPPGHASVNSNFAIDWHSAHFGYPSRVRFYTSGIDNRYIRVFLSNPDRDKRTAEVDVPLAEEPAGSVADGERSLDVFFAVESKIRDKIQCITLSELSSPVFPANIVA
ncbi:hypothetical protein C8T65DRAFT_190108 [Cerioporus squamosus]|nr:hypothetical protein C8T65DRAFT_190108 [Cerioporus squamosus]